VDKDHDSDRMYDDWEEQGDTERAVAVGARGLEQVRDGRLDPVANLESIERWAEAQFDGVGGRPSRVVGALRTAIPELRRAEALAGHATDRFLELRFRPQVLLCRAYHVAGDTARDALNQSYACVWQTVDLAGGLLPLREALRRSYANPVAEHAVGALGIFMATLRRTDLPEQTRATLVRVCRELVTGYVLDAEDEPVRYRRTDALAAQGFYLFNAIADPADVALVEALYRLDVATRPLHARAQATRALRDFEYARFRNDEAAVAAYRVQAVTDLSRCRLRRHKSVVAEQGYLAAA